ncbi:Leucine-rich repeat protein kinase family protein [Rhynchospora pubera]|uniref:Leucine-rich repeat protein kinase family protein n=1 Tax=Rhynchospora pubera TaxID=906938 RepID=A0AAV8F724_9POAL|nr:Leucine-rich repeat protein kinase family protein [Rhynchospora pubera]
MDLWFILLLVIFVSSTSVDSQNDSDGTFINIDCGLPEKSNITDVDTGLVYVSDDQFIDTGVNYKIASKYASNDLLKQLLTVRSFPNGTRNCYTLRSLSAQSKYFLRATFMYGNYDNKNHPPIFYLYLGVNFWYTVNIPSPNGAFFTEIIAIAPSDYLQVCLIDKNLGTPFISTLELRQMETTFYKDANATQSLVSHRRYNIGASYQLRYPDDPYDRIWAHGQLSQPTPLWLKMTQTLEFPLS